MSDLNKIIEEAYEKSNFGSVEKVYKIIIKTHPDFNKKLISKYIHDQDEDQIFNQQKEIKPMGHITATFPFEIVQMDIFDLSKYSPYNNNYKYMLCFVDVFTRKLFVYKMKTKNIDETTKGLETILKEIDHKIYVIMSDNDSSFLGEKFQDLLEDNKIILDPQVLNDHHALGIIDNMAKRLKLILAKHYIRSKSKNWINVIQKVINNYNDSEHSSLDGLSPNDALKKENYQTILHINFNKMIKEKPKIKDKSRDKGLNKGDFVRIRTKTIFSKQSDGNFSNEIYEVIDVYGNNVFLSDDKTYKRTNLLKVNKLDITDTDNPITEVIKENKINRQIKKSGVDRNDDKSTLYETIKTRERKKKVKIDL